MKKIYSLLFLLSTCLAFGQVIQTRFLNVDRGKNQKFEAGVEKKTKMFNSKEGQLRFYTFRINSGINTGKYFRVRYEDEISGFDINPPAAALKLWQDEIGDIMTADNTRWLGYNKNASHVNVSPFSKPLRRVMEYSYRAEMGDEFWRFRLNVAKAIKESNADIFMEVWNCASGCDGNTVLIVFGHSDFKELGQDNSVEWGKVYDKYEELNGEGSYDKDISNFNKSLEIYGRRTYNMSFLPELSSPENMSNLDKLTTD
jgi:hypothetical protein